MKSYLLILLLSFFTFSSAANTSNHSALVRRAVPAQKIFFENNSLVQYLFEMTDLDPSFRLISKDFKKAHDKYCYYYLALIDSRLKHYFNDIRTSVTDGRFVASLVSPTLRLEVPLYYLFSKYLKAYVSTVPKPANQIQDITEVQEQQDALTLRSVDIAEGKKFIKDVMKAFTGLVFGFNGRNLMGPGYLLYLYILAKSCFTMDELYRLEFPYRALLLHAAKGEIPAPYDEEIVRNFETNFIARLAFDALKAERIDLARIILNKPGVSNSLAKFADDGTLMTTLHYCALYGAVDLVDKCLEMGASPLATNFENFKPIHYAVIYGHIEVVRRLFELDPFVARESGSTISPLFVACYSGRSEIVEFFLSHPRISLIGNRLLSENMANSVLASGNDKMAQVLLNYSGKLELSDESYGRLHFLASNN